MAVLVDSIVVTITARQCAKPWLLVAGILYKIGCDRTANWLVSRCVRIGRLG